MHMVTVTQYCAFAVCVPMHHMTGSYHDTRLQQQQQQQAFLNPFWDCFRLSALPDRHVCHSMAARRRTFELAVCSKDRQSLEVDCYSKNKRDCLMQGLTTC